MGKFAPMLALDRAVETSRRREVLSAAADVVALDRQPTARSYDAGSGHLTVKDSIISAATVSFYNAIEIPDAVQLGLDMTRTYALYRDPVALAASAPTFERVPLLSAHAPLNAADHPHDAVVGTVGNVVWHKPTQTLRADVTVWDQDAIDRIEDGSRAGLSCGYSYVCLLQPGTVGGVAFAGKMVAIVGNHVSLVSLSRVPQAMVGDAAPSQPRVQAKPLFVSRAAAAWRHETKAAHRVDMARRYPGIAALRNLRP